MDEQLARDDIDLVRLDREPGGEEDATATVQLAERVDATWIVADGYRFGSDYQRSLREAGSKVLVLDDLARLDRYHADVLLNQNLHAGTDLYPGLDPDTRLLLGTRYALLRREFAGRPEGADHSDTGASESKGRGSGRIRLLVSFGGGRTSHDPLRVVEALAPLLAADDPGLEVVLVAGEADGRGGGASSVPPGVRQLSGVRDMASLMADSDLALSAAGSTCWELAAMGVPTIVFSIADNQVKVAQGLADAGLAIDLGRLDDVQDVSVRDAVAGLSRDVARRRKMRDSARKLVDGEGSGRVVMHLLGARLRLRKARPTDSRLLWAWRNEATVRAQSFSSEAIPWQDHERWYAARLASPDAEILIAVDGDDAPIGQVRFDFDDEGDAEISVSLGHEARGRGLGCELIGLASARRFVETDARLIHAFIKPENEASARAFLKAGYEPVGEISRRGLPALHYARSRPS